MPRNVWICLLIFLLPLTAAAFEAEDGQRVFLVKGYSYESGSAPGDPVMGQALCGTRCNSLSSDYLNFIRPGGWRMLQVSADREVVVDLNNPFMEGRCVCLTDEYMVKLDDYNRPKGLQKRSGEIVPATACPEGNPQTNTAVAYDRK